MRHLADRNDATRTEIEAAGGVAPLVALMRDSPYPGRANATWALASLARNKAIVRRLAAVETLAAAAARCRARCAMARLSSISGAGCNSFCLVGCLVVQSRYKVTARF